MKSSAFVLVVRASVFVAVSVVLIVEVVIEFVEVLIELLIEVSVVVVAGELVVVIVCITVGVVAGSVDIAVVIKSSVGSIIYAERSSFLELTIESRALNRGLLFRDLRAFKFLGNGAPVTSTRPSRESPLPR